MKEQISKNAITRHYTTYMFNSLYHYRFGKQSNIPTCCINFFILYWVDTGVLNKYYVDKRWDNEPHNVWYVRCPQCRKQNKIIKVKEGEYKWTM